MIAARSASLSLVADCGGLVCTIALALPASFFADGWSHNAVSPLVPIGHLLSALPADVRAVILIDRSCLAPARNWLDGLDISCTAELLPLDGNNQPSHPWIQDMLHVRAGDGGEDVEAELLSTAENVITGALAHHLGLVTKVLDIVLAGGNQLVGPDFRLVGHSSLHEDRGIGKSVGAERSERWQRIQALDGRTVHRFGYRPEDLGKSSTPFDLSLLTASAPVTASEKMHQCGFHVDQFVSVTGLKRDGHPLLLLADPVALEVSYGRIATDLKRKLDASALSLARQGFAIQRNPIPVLPAIDTNKCLPRLYNNVLLENVTRSGQKRPFVWVPHFGDIEALAGFDEENRQIWERLGFHAVGVAGWSHLASRNGALRCATKVINRGSSKGS